jgi:hypothetical protein
MDAALGMALPGGATLLNQGVRKVAGKAAVSIYQSAAKYPSFLKVAEKTKLTLAALREKVMFNPESIERLGNINDELTSVADEAMIYANMRGEGVATNSIKESFWSVTNRLKKDPLFDKKITEGIQRSYGEAVDNLPAYMTPQEVIAWRRSLNQQLAGHFDRMKKAGLPSGESSLLKAKEAVRGSVNQEILNMVPELKALGQRQKEVIDLIMHTERATSRSANWDVLGLGSLVVGDIFADAAGVSPTTKMGALGTAAAGMVAWRVAGSPNAKARIAFALAKVGKLNSASPQTLELIGLTREAARRLEPTMKALPFPRTMSTGKPDASGVVSGGQETVHAVDTPDIYETMWRKAANEAEELRQGGQFPVIPGVPKRNLHGKTFRGTEEEWVPPRTAADVENQMKEYGMDVYDRIRRGYLGDNLLGDPARKTLGVPLENLERGLLYQGKKLR